MPGSPFHPAPLRRIRRAARRVRGACNVFRRARASPRFARARSRCHAVARRRRASGAGPFLWRRGTGYDACKGKCHAAHGRTRRISVGFAHARVCARAPPHPFSPRPAQPLGRCKICVFVLERIKNGYAVRLLAPRALSPRVRASRVLSPFVCFLTATLLPTHAPPQSLLPNICEEVLAKGATLKEDEKAKEYTAVSGAARAWRARAASPPSHPQPSRPRARPTCAPYATAVPQVFGVAVAVRRVGAVVVSQGLLPRGALRRHVVCEPVSQPCHLRRHFDQRRHSVLPQGAHRL